MSTNVSLELKPETQDQIAARARARGISVEDYIRHVLEEHAGNSEASLSETSTPEEWEAKLDAFTQSPAFQNISWTVDDSRESIYREREESQL